jgi:hypothetical protein
MADRPKGSDEWMPLPGGFSNQVSRRGDMIKRRVGPQSAAVYQLLHWLQERQFTRVPRFIQADADEEILTFLEGEAVFRPWSATIKTHGWMDELGTWLREYHQAVQGFQLTADSRFIWGPLAPLPGMVVNHGDLGPWNVIHQQGRVSGVIDWDLARFGDPLDDLAQLALEAVPLKPSTADRLGTNLKPAVISERFNRLCLAYGAVDALTVLRHTVGYLERMAAEIERLGSSGVVPFARFKADGVPGQYRAEARFITLTFLSL